MIIFIFNPINKQLVINKKTFGNKNKTCKKVYKFK